MNDLLFLDASGSCLFVKWGPIIYIITIDAKKLDVYKRFSLSKWGHTPPLQSVAPPLSTALLTYIIAMLDGEFAMTELFNISIPSKK